MRVRVEDDAGRTVWSFGHGYGEASNAFLSDGTQERIIAAMIDALGEARGQMRLSRPLLEVADAVSDVGLASGRKGDDHVPVAGTRHSDPDGKHPIEAAMIMERAATSVAAEIAVRHDEDVALMVAVDDYNVTRLKIFSGVNKTHDGTSGRNTLRRTQVPRE